MVGDDEFWACVEDGVIPARSAAPVAASMLPLALVWQLAHTAGIAEHIVAAMTKEQAVQAINDYWMSEPVPALRSAQRNVRRRRQSEPPVATNNLCPRNPSVDTKISGASVPGRRDRIGKAMSTETKPTNHRSNLNGIELLGGPVKHPLRALPVVALVVAGAAHIPVIPAHLHEAPYIGILFIVLTAASFVLATVLALDDVPAAYFSTAVVMGLAILGYVISRTIGLPQIGDDIGNWLEPLGVVAVIAEATACLSAVAIGLKARHQAGTPT